MDLKVYDNPVSKISPLKAVHFAPTTMTATRPIYSEHRNSEGTLFLDINCDQLYRLVEADYHYIQDWIIRHCFTEGVDDWTPLGYVYFMDIPSSTSNIDRRCENNHGDWVAETGQDLYTEYGREYTPNYSKKFLLEMLAPKEGDRPLIRRGGDVADQ